MDDFSAALAAFEREQAAEAAAVEAYGDKIVSGTVIKQTEKHLVIDVGLKSEGLVPLEQVLDHTGAVKFQPGDAIDVVIEREEPEGGYLVSYERAQRLRVWDTIEKAANDKTPVMGTVVSRVKGGLTVDIGIKAFLPGSQLEIRPVRNLDGYLGQQIEVRVIKLNKKRGNVVVSRKEILEEEQNAKRSHDAGAAGRGRGADRHGEEPDRLRRVRRPGRHRRPAAHHRHELGTADASPRPGECGRRDPGEGAQVRQGQAARFAGLQAVDARSVAGRDGALPGGRAACRAACFR